MGLSRIARLQQALQTLVAEPGTGELQVVPEAAAFLLVSFAPYPGFTPERAVKLLTTLCGFEQYGRIVIGWNAEKEVYIKLVVAPPDARRLAFVHALVEGGAEYWLDQESSYHEFRWPRQIASTQEEQTQ